MIIRKRSTIDKRIVIDKSAAEIDKFLESARIIYNAENGITRNEFCTEMKKYMGCHESTQCNDANENRKFFNKCKWLLYYGFAKKIKSTSENEETLIITERGKELVNNCVIYDDETESPETKLRVGTEDIMVDLIIKSILFDSFGSFNDGVDTSHSDIEPPKIILKAIDDLGYLTSIESIYLIYYLDRDIYSNYGDAIKTIKSWRAENNTKDIENIVEELGGTNFVSDNKLLKFLERVELLNCDEEKKYTITSKYYEKYKNEIKGINYRYTPDQKIYFGPPGTGKSYYIEHVVLGGININKNLFRINFHPDYTYNDFVGHILPTKTEDGIDYEFKAGPFTLILKEALLNPKEKYYLVIEEINRGNAASIFGDMFQLLDRVDNRSSKYTGWSKYGIKNSDIYDYITKGKSNENIAKLSSDNTIKIPNNLSILATMNTADQNVFTIDSAFKRRFQIKYIPINFDNNINFVSHKYDIFEGEKDLVDIFKDINFISELIENEGIDRSWCGFAKIVNSIIDKINSESFEISEDKKLGQFFVKEEDLNNRENFASKVLYHLKHDVFKYNEKYFTHSFEKIYSDVVLNSKDIFEILKPRNLN